MIGPPWKHPPTKNDFFSSIEEFFRRLSRDDQRGARAMLSGLFGRAQAIEDEAWRQMMRSLWEDLEDWREDFDNPAFESSWLTHLTPPDLVSEPGLLGVDWSSGADPMEEGDHLLINIFFLNEPTDDTARFSLLRDPSAGWLISLDNIEVL